MRPATCTVTLEGSRRLGCSVNGNPRFELFTDQGTFIVSSDASCNYEVTNYRTPARVHLWLTRAGRVSYMSPAS